jgi:hypothetical protein
MEVSSVSSGDIFSSALLQQTHITGSPVMRNERDIAWYKTREALPNLAGSRDLYLRTILPKYTDIRNSGAGTTIACKTAKCSVRDMLGASPGVRQRITGDYLERPSPMAYGVSYRRPVDARYGCTSIRKWIDEWKWTLTLTSTCVWFHRCAIRASCTLSQFGCPKFGVDPPIISSQHHPIFGLRQPRYFAPR